ncbi:cysteine hydrolase [Bradyrhizobium sp. WSM 1704]|uniref:cysteine hydrolase family protein n=1 Tax=Bradyrhizobium semiaridum TaxID=2821404 RepID=UPI001CE2BFA1|nr:cysteine hydrolase [Bradyrhizobium semiaridum]MCA6120323.1 cysteine hydrolase [Bradyrhizobium semiaridum]
MGQLLSAPGPQAVHLCIDMQRLFAPGSPWATPWMPRVLPRIVELTRRAPERTVFTRFVPPRSKLDARGTWRLYYEKWECVTRDRIDPALLELVPELAVHAPPAAVIDRVTYNAFGNGRLQAHLTAHKVDTVIVSGGETDVCVLATVLGAIDIGYRIIIAEDALCSSSDQSHDALLQLYGERFSIQIEVASTADILRIWSVDD